MRNRIEFDQPYKLLKQLCFTSTKQHNNVLWKFINVYNITDFLIFECEYRYKSWHIIER
jgi:hypothetical protein